MRWGAPRAPPALRALATRAGERREALVGWESSRGARGGDVGMPAILTPVSPLRPPGGSAGRARAGADGRGPPGHRQHARPYAWRGERIADVRVGRRSREHDADHLAVRVDERTPGVAGLHVRRDLVHLARHCAFVVDVPTLRAELRGHRGRVHGERSVLGVPDDRGLGAARHCGGVQGEDRTEGAAERSTARSYVGLKYTTVAA